MERTGEGPSGPGVGVANRGRSTRPTCWSQSGTEGPHCAILNEAVLAGTGTVLTQGQFAHYLHVDDGLFMTASGDPYVGHLNVMHKCADTLESLGFIVGDRRGAPATGDGAARAEELGKVIGYVHCRSPAQLRPPGPKLAKLHLAFTTLISYDKVCVDSLHSLVGLWLWMMLLRRDLLCIGHGLFQFIERNQGRYVKWWESARDEVRCIADTLMLCILDVGAPLAPAVYATDAMGASEVDAGGFAIVGADVSQEVLYECWRAGPQPAKTVVKLNGDTTHLRKKLSRIEARIPVSKLPETLFDPNATSWDLIRKGRWAEADAIQLGEGWATVMLLEVLAGFAGAHRSKVLASWEGGLGKGLRGGWSPPLRSDRQD